MRRNHSPRRRWAALPAVLLALAGAAPAAAQCNRTKIARVAALEQMVWYNRLGAHQPDALLFALEQDVVNGAGTAQGATGDARLRDGRRPRPLVLRVNAGECLRIVLRNLLSPGFDAEHRDTTRSVSIHVNGMQLVSSIADDGSAVQRNAASLVAPGASRTYTLFAEREGTFLLYSAAQMTGGEGDGGQIGRGLFGAVNVEPPGAEYYRSQVTRADLQLADPSGADSLHYPQLDYAAVYPSGPLAGRPILKMLKGDTLVWSDLSAIITGPGRGSFAQSAYPRPGVPVYPQRLLPFREHTVIFHDEAGLVQAFEAIYRDPRFRYTLQGGRDAFAINYGTGGIGSEILANRFGLGPMAKCNDCKFEEFFLSSWAVGDPAMVLSNPAAADFDPGNPGASTLHHNAKVLYPDDPSNVFHSYLNDHVKIRNLHAGPREHHIFHLHAHQWLNTPNDSASNYKDSQAIGPGNGFTYEITYGGSGNRNETPGDAIFHCHFYPHFAQGMWGLWRNHDVFERGSVLDENGRVYSRGLPDGEISAGTPIPAVVPIPGYAVAPLPTATMPGFPFYIPGEPGHRPPQPPLDLAFDGGLARHVVTGGVATFPELNTRDFSKHDSLLTVRFLPDTGTVLERAAMAFHAQKTHPTVVAGAWTTPASFRTNGLDPQPGAPFADPCGIKGVEMGTPVQIRAAGFQVSATYNKAGWSFPQHRMFALWGDVKEFVDSARAPEPLFFRAHTGSCITYHLVNLIPSEYRVDDFQVQTPTDIIGQHIHLVKFDVTSSDGAANGFNYEDGALAPDAVRQSIRAIRRQNDCVGADSGDTRDGNRACPKARPHPDAAFSGHPEWVGAQENLQRWWVDPVPRGAADTSALPTVFTHDHFGPSTHQQAGLYAGLLPEDRGTTWRDPETGAALGVDADGGPTSWRADILYQNARRNHREFGIQIADFALAYGAEGFAGSAGRTPPINPPGRNEPGLTYLLRPPLAGACPNDSLPPCPEVVSADDPGTMLINYRNEPLALRIRNPGNNTQRGDSTGDLALAYADSVQRRDSRLNTYGPYGRRGGELPRDPFTPLLRVYENDRISIRLLVGAHEEGHNWGINGARWFFERLSHNSGMRASQMAGISEWHEFNLNPLMSNAADTLAADFHYRGGSAVDDQWNGQWGVIRAYRTAQRGQDTLLALSPAPRSTSLFAARLDAAAGVDAKPDSLQALAGMAGPLPDPDDPGSWFGGLAALDASRPTIPASLLAAFNAGTATAADSVRAGYGNQALGGRDAESFEYDPVARREYVASDDSAVAADPEYAQAAPGSAEAEEPSGAGTWQRGGSPNVGFWGVCPRIAPLRYFEVAAIPAAALPGGRLVYNTRTARGGPLYDPTAVVYVYDADLRGGLLGRNPEPLVLRVNAGDCVLVRLRNRLPAQLPVADGWNTLPMIVDQLNANQLRPSSRAGLNAQLLTYDVQRSDGSQVGINRNTTAAAGQWRWYQWYAGTVKPARGDSSLAARPVEFGAVNLVSPDRVLHSNKGAAAALVVEPRRARWRVDPANRAAADVLSPGGGFRFREQVLLLQNDVNLRFGSAVDLPVENCDDPDPDADPALCQGHTGVVTAHFSAGDPVPSLAREEDPEDSGQKGLNYRTEPLWFRRGFAPDATLGFTRRLNLTQVLRGDSAQTPLFVATAGDSVRLRVLEPGGHARNHVFVLHGHVWEQEPYAKGSGIIAHNPLSEWKGARDGHGPGEHFEVVPRGGAGGLYQVPGDYLYRDQASFGFDGGIWGVMRVVPPSGARSAVGTGGFVAPGRCVIDAQTGVTTCN